MARPHIDLHAKVCELLTHTSPPLKQSECPLRHFEQSANIGHALIKYLEDHIDTSQTYESVYDRHLAQLRRMVLADLIESFERFLKELAAVAVDVLAPYVADDRFDDFMPRSESLAAFVHAKSIGKALCESGTWLKPAAINDRFRMLLKSHFGEKWEFLFPEKNQLPAAHRQRAQTLNVLWQIRHNLAHNVGMLTESDAMKFRMLVGKAVAANCRLAPSSDDLRYAKRFLVETAELTNQRVGNRLGELLGDFYASDSGLFNDQAKADEVSTWLGVSITVNGKIGNV